MLRKNLVAIVFTTTLVLNSLTAQAITIIQPTFATASTETSTENNGTRPANATRDGSGLSSALGTGDPIPGVYPNHDTTATGMWAAAGGDSAPFITFDLGAEYNISGFHVWNFNQPSFTNVGARVVNVSFSTTSLVSGFGSSELFSGANELSIAPAAAYAGEDRFFSTDHLARWVRFDVIANHGNTGNLAGLSEIRFFNNPIVVPVVPEPSTFVLLGAGLTGMVALARRRRASGENISNLKSEI